MECNKDDAIKAKEIAERKFNFKDIAGAKKFALKAQQLYPGLEGIAQLLVTLDVYVSAENKIIGETDWYGVLGVSPQADEDSIRKQYRKLALILHPDKNRSIGADGAFNLVSRAWNLLSDKSRKTAYDAKRNAKVEPPSKGSFRPFATNGMYNFTKNTTSDPKLNEHKNVHRTNGTSTSGSSNKSKSNRSTFWTVCHRCRMQYEYLRSYLNQNLLCPSCRQPFFAVEQPAPDSKSSRPSSKPWNSEQHSRKPHQDSRTKSSPISDFQWAPFSGAAGSSVAQAADVVQQTYEKARCVREEAQAAKKRDRVIKRKKYVYENMNSSSIEKRQKLSDHSGMNNHQMDRKNVGDSGSLQTSMVRKINISGVLPQNELHSMLMNKARKEITKKLNGRKSAGVVDCAAEKAKTTEKGTTTTNSDLDDVGWTEVQISVPVPEPDFHDFDQFRTERDFKESQVWAVYDNADGMPRHYVMIHRIISRDPFKLRISSLKSKISTELCPINWVCCGFTITCGDFRVGRHETYDALKCFSHEVRWTKGLHGPIYIFPRKGDVWALYRNWSPDWDEFTDDNIIHKYDIMEVLEDYDEDLGVVIIPLVKVAGFKALFHQHLDPEQVKRIPKEEIFRFSHQVPSHLISGQESPKAVKVCRQLDPAALPDEFLQVIDDSTEGPSESKAIKQQNATFQEDTMVTINEETKEEVT